MMVDKVQGAPDWRVRSATARDRRGWVEVELMDANGERITYAGFRSVAMPLYSIAGLTPGQRAAGVLYGALREEVTHGGIPAISLEAVGGGGGGGPEGAVDRRLRMRKLLERADLALRVAGPLEPARFRGKVAQLRASEQVLRTGALHVSRVVAGEMLTEARRPIPSRAMVDQVCVEGRGLGQVVMRYGWQNTTSARKRAAGRLAETLQLMATAMSGGWAEGRSGGAVCGVRTFDGP